MVLSIDGLELQTSNAEFQFEIRIFSLCETKSISIIDFQSFTQTVEKTV